MKKLRNLLIVGGLHGDENTGIEIAKRTGGLLANPLAINANRRFIETDLNRSFGVETPISLEEKLASDLTKTVMRNKYVLDIHDTKAQNCTSAIVVTRFNKYHLGIANYFGMKRIVRMPTSGSLISLMPRTSISLEYSKNEVNEMFINRITEKIGKLDFTKLTKGEIKLYQFAGKVLRSSLDRLDIDINRFNNFEKIDLSICKQLGLKNKLFYYPFFLKKNEREEIAFTLLKSII